MSARLALRVAALAVVASSCYRPGLDPSPERLQPGPPLEAAWSVAGHWTGVAWVPGSTVVAYAVRSGELFTVDLRDGKAVPSGARVGPNVRMATLKGEPALISFDPFADRVRADTPGGSALWTYQTTEGILDVWPVDVDADGQSEVIVALTGGGGMLVLDPTGERRWSNKSIADAWHVTTGRLNGGPLRILTPSATGGVRVFSTWGDAIAEVGARVFTTQIRVGDQVFVAGSGQDEGGSFVATFDPRGWITRVSDRQTATHALAALPSVPWVAVSTTTGNVYALRASTGAIEGAASGVGGKAEVEWAVGEDGAALLVVAGANGLKAFRVGGARDAR